MQGDKGISQRLPRRRRGWLAVLSAGVLVWAVPGAGYAELPAAGVEIQFREQVVTIKVTQPTPLSTVLEELCRQAQARCELQVEEATEVVPPLTIRGGWQEAVAQLLQGSRLNYASLAPAPGQAARLIVGPRPEGGGERLAGRSSTAEWEESARATSGYDGALRDPPRERWTEAEPAGQESELGSAIIGGAASAEREAMRSSSSQNADSPYHLPPFMGGPPVPPTGEPPGLPFPDENGNPIPLSNQPLTGLPFPDENGNPIPLTPLRPGQNPGSPFPPDTPTPRRE